jgi:hypothetical protein
MKNKKYVVLGIFAVLAAALLIFSSNLQSQSKASPQMQLGGGFIGSSNGIIFDALQVPLDPAGRTAALHLKFHNWLAETAGLLSAFGADTLTESTGQVKMTGRNTFNVSWIAYGIKQGNPPLIRLIIVYTGAAQFTGPDSYDITGTFDIYPAAADDNGDGFPDSGIGPFMSIPGFASAKRVPIP